MRNLATSWPHPTFGIAFWPFESHPRTRPLADSILYQWSSRRFWGFLEILRLNTMLILTCTCWFCPLTPSYVNQDFWRKKLAQRRFSRWEWTGSLPETVCCKYSTKNNVTTRLFRIKRGTLWRMFYVATVDGVWFISLQTWMENVDFAKICLWYLITGLIIDLESNKPCQSRVLVKSNPLLLFFR